METSGLDPEITICKIAVLPIKLCPLLLHINKHYILDLSIIKLLLLIYLISTENIRFERMWFKKPNKTQAYHHRPLGQFSLKYNNNIWFLSESNTEHVLIKNTLYQLS
jgi:hypothetical protein